MKKVRSGAFYLTLQLSYILDRHFLLDADVHSQQNNLCFTLDKVLLLSYIVLLLYEQVRKNTWLDNQLSRRLVKEKNCQVISNKSMCFNLHRLNCSRDTHILCLGNGCAVLLLICGKIYYICMDLR